MRLVSCLARPRRIEADSCDGVSCSQGRGRGSCAGAVSVDHAATADVEAANILIRWLRKGMRKSRLGSLGSVSEFLQTLVSCGGETDPMQPAQPGNSALAKVLDGEEQQTLLQAPAAQDLAQPDPDAATLANNQQGALRFLCRAGVRWD